MSESNGPRVQVGRRAPAFELQATGEPEVLRLDSFDGRWLMLFFYPEDFSLLCPLEITALDARYDELTEAGLSVVGISTDTIEQHREWISAPRSSGGLGGRLAFPLASDFDRITSRDYGVLLESRGVALRGIFMIDPNGVLQYSSVHTLSIGRSVDEILRILHALKTGGMCPPGWQPGQTPLDLTQYLRPGMLFDQQFKIEHRIGAGGMGAVYQAEDTRLKRKVALKVLSGDAISGPEERMRFLREARAAAAVAHPNICGVHQIHDADSGMYLVLQLVEGEDLTDQMGEGLLPVERVIEIGAQLADALSAVHAEGLVHRDIKPGNIRISDAGRAILLDFGLARRRLDDDLEEEVDEHSDTQIQAITKAGMMVGTVAYMSPEQTEGDEVGGPSDIFSLGTTLYEMLTGISPFADRKILATVARIQCQTPQPPHELQGEVTAELSAIVMDMLAKVPDDRPAAEAVRDRLRAIA